MFASNYLSQRANIFQKAGCNFNQNTILGF
uniref:Uncharacterized protein n=1 Tax=Rhizophora mucronata TaxID=61149 RepID=A0A2P2Q7C4_RHIMU